MNAWGKTSAGVVRETNEDTFRLWVSADGRRGLFAVCDGMGGANAGEVASGMAAEAFDEATAPMREGAFSMRDAQKRLQKAAETANARIFKAAQSHEEQSGMGTTMVTMACNCDAVAIGNIGDSRAYLADENGLRQINHDPSLGSELIRRGELTPMQALRHPSRNVITRALGVDEQVPCDLFTLEVKAGDMLLLCSDGLTGELSDPEIYYEIYQSGDPEGACGRMIEMACARGGHDNITAVLAVF